MKKRQKRERKKQDRGIVDFMMITNHFFHSLREWILEMDDPRNQSYTIYTQADLTYMAILKNICGQHSMREMEENFNKETCIDTLRIMSGNQHLEEMPHYDTLNYYQLNEGFEWIKSDEEVMYQTGLCKEKGTAFYANHVEEAAGKTEIMNVFEYGYKTRNKHRIRFQWVTSLELTKGNLEEMIYAGRGRWKIENEGFNNQKKGLYRIEHLNSKNNNAMKNHYLITQISDILMQLYLAWNPYVKELKQTIKNTSSELLESFRRLTVTEEDVCYINNKTILTQVVVE